jgi:succinoglycan biosynthesis transport protein ExoP
MELNTQDVHLSHYWNIIYKRWKIALAIFATVMLGAYLASYFSTPQYLSRIQIQIERENPNQLTIDDLFGIEASDQEFLQTQYYLLSSRGLAERVIEDQRLLSDPEFNPGGIAGKSKAEQDALKHAMAPGLAGMVKVEPVRSTSIVAISYTALSPKLAKKVAEGIGEAFIRMNIEKKIDSVNKTTEYLSKQIVTVKSELDEAREQLQKFGQQADIVAVGSADSMGVQRVTKLNADLSSATNERIDKESRYNTLLNASAESVPEVTGNSLVAQLRDEEARYSRDYQQKLATFRPDHPEMVKLRDMLNRTQQQRVATMKDALQKVRDAARNDLLAARSREESMKGAFEAAKQDTYRTNISAMTYTDLHSVIESKQQSLDTLTKRRNEAEVSSRLRGSNSSNIHWVDHAELPAGRVNSNMRKNLQSAFPLGIILGLAAIFFLEYMDRSIKSPEELEKVTRFASLGVVPSAASIGRGAGYYGSRYGSAPLRAVEQTTGLGDDPKGIDLLPHFDSRSPISEAYRAFRTSLLLASANSPKVIVITSTFAREGKTTTSVNLGTVLAQMGKPVLLIDGDLRRPRLQKVFPGKMNLGLVNYLAANIPLEDVIQETVVPHLSVILSGPTPPNPSELLASDRMKNLIHDIRSKFAFVIFDSPPVLAVTDSIVLAASADGVVLCVHGGQTPRELVQRAADRLRQSNIPVLGAILNNLDLQQYGYTFKKNYYDYYDSDDSDRTEKRAKTS